MHLVTTAQMTATDRRDITNHVMMFGGAALVKKVGRKWAVSFRSFGPPNLFPTKTAAVDWASRWPSALARTELA